jgi:hypothetical protein
MVNSWYINIRYTIICASIGVPLKWNRFRDKKLGIAVRKFFPYWQVSENRGNPSLFFRFRKSGLKSAVIKMFLELVFITE